MIQDTNRGFNRAVRLLPLASILCFAISAHAFPIATQGDFDLDGHIEIGMGLFHNSEDYSSPDQQRGAVTWQEGYVKTGLSARRNAWYGSVSGLASGTTGDGDAGGFTQGNEHTIVLEDAYLGWKNDYLDVSLGSQNFVLGDGFLIAGDTISLGTGVEGAPEVNRGGAYWLAPRKTFRKTAIARMESGTPLRGDVFWLQSDNAEQASTGLVGVNLEWTDKKLGTLGASWLKILSVDATEFLGSLAERDNMNVFNIRATGDMGIESLFLAAGYVREDFNAAAHNDASAWYAEAGYTFNTLPFSPSLNYRHSHFSDTFDPLFYGFTTGYGTWFQGEVAGNYTGPFNSNANIQEIALRAKPSENINAGALFFIFNTDVPDAGQSDSYGRELNLYLEWNVNEHLWISPLFGHYWPGSGFPGTNKHGSNYVQLVAIYSM